MHLAQLPTRQIHLDFHNPREILSMGEDFDPAQFAQTMAEAEVDSVTVFAKCAHGFSYYPTRVGTTHPALTFDLMGEQIRALHAEGIRAPLYICIGWDTLAAEEHPEWVSVGRDGYVLGPQPLKTVSPTGELMPWATVDVGSGYADYVADQVSELCRDYPVDGFFFDIVWTEPNFSPHSQRAMRDAGIALDDSDAVFGYAQQIMLKFLDRISSIIRQKTPAATIFYNGTVDLNVAATISSQTHLEIESLPTGGEAYYPFYPLLARYARSFGLPILGMTARFHSAWGDFGGLKTAEQMTYECGTILAAGGAISIGDQLDPSGKLDPAVYRMIRTAFRAVGELGPWFTDARPSAEIAILAASEERRVGARDTRVLTDDVQGAAQMFLERGIQFDIVEGGSAEFQQYRALLLPDGISVDNHLLQKLESYRESGGKLILSGTAALGSRDEGFLLRDAPMQFVGERATVPCYFRLDDQLSGGEAAPDYDYVFYDQGYVVEPAGGSQCFGTMNDALFNRSWDHWISHAQAPVGRALTSPLVVLGPDVLYFAAPLFGAYLRHDYWIYRSVVERALDEFLPDRLLRWGGPGSVEASHHGQTLPDGSKRQIVHLVSYHPRRTVQRVPHVDEAVSIAGLSLEVRDPQKSLRRAYVAPGRVEIAAQHTDDGYLRVELPPVGTHTVVVFE